MKKIFLAMVMAAFLSTAIGCAGIEGAIQGMAAGAARDKVFKTLNKNYKPQPVKGWEPGNP